MRSTSPRISHRVSEVLDTSDAEERFGMIKKDNAKTLKSIHGLSVAITGICWIGRYSLARLIRKRGGLITPNYAVTVSTDVLVRGASVFWKHKTYGRKEAKAAQLIQHGKRLVVVPDYEFQKLMERDKPARVASTVAGQPIEWLVAPPEVVFDNICKIPGALDREYTTKGRLEQGYLRKQLFNEKSSSNCAICGHEFPIELLIAAHIKPRSECTLEEKRDASNIVFPLCLFGCDSLYERGYISIDAKGYLTVAKTPELTKSVKEYLRNIDTVASLSKKSRCGSCGMKMSQSK